MTSHTQRWLMINFQCWRNKQSDWKMFLVFTHISPHPEQLWAQCLMDIWYNLAMNGQPTVLQLPLLVNMFLKCYEHVTSLCWQHVDNQLSTCEQHLIHCAVPYSDVLHKWRSQFPDGVWSQLVMAGMRMCVLPVFEPVTEGVYTLGQRGWLHPVLLLPLLVVLLCSHRGQLLDGGGGGDDHSVWTLPC